MPSGQKNSSWRYILYKRYYCFEGNVGCEIRKEFRRKGYAYEVLCLLRELLKERDIDSFSISTYNNNIASKRQIEKYRPTRVRQIGNILQYEVKTRTAKKN